jgi:predicted transcriptional regulator
VTLAHLRDALVVLAALALWSWIRRRSRAVRGDYRPTRSYRERRGGL